MIICIWSVPDSSSPQSVGGTQTDFISISFGFIPRQVLEYMGGGDLLNLLIERDVFEEDFTRFYVAEVCSLTTLTPSLAL